MRALVIASLLAAAALVVGGCASGDGSSGPGTDGSSSGGSGSGGGSGSSSSGGSSGGSSGSSSGGSSGSGSSSGGSSSGGSSGGGSSGGSSGGGSSGGSSGGGSGSSSGGTNPGVPNIGGCQVFPADNPWNTRIDDTNAFPVHPSSATYIASMSATTHLHPDWGDWSTNHYGIPWQVVPAGQAMVPMTFDTASESDPGPYPFPANALVEGGANSGGDMHVLVVESGSCALYETWSTTYTGPGWHAGSGAKFDLSANTLRPDGWTSADAAGLPILPGLVRVSEVTAGAINHALRFTVASTQQGFIHPATHAAGSANTSLPPMGLRLRLKSTFDTSPFSGATLVILTAMKQYGLILADNGSNWYVSGDSDDKWIPLIDQIVSDFGKVTGNDFEAVQTGPILQ
jgi:hypothetical protein